MSLFESLQPQTPERKILTVSELSAHVRSLLEGELNGVWLVGEISNFLAASSGHLYLSLKDRKSQVRAVMFKFAARHLRFRPENGLEVLCYGRVSYYEPRGDCQFIIEDMSPKGLGALQLAFEQLKEKLQREGLFEQSRKRPIPTLPRRVGVVTSATGAAIHDIINVLTRRFPNISVLLYPTLVQGADAPAQIVKGLRTLNERDDVDVLIVGRGGGSAEDLFAFNDEAVARAIVASRIPVISAVGHEVDFTIADFVADLRAPTPSAAAELAVPDKAALARRIEVLRGRLRQAVERPLERSRRILSPQEQARLIRRQQERVARLGEHVDDLRDRVQGTLRDQRRDLRHRLQLAVRSLTAHAPQLRLARNQERLRNLEGRLRRCGEALLAPRSEHLRNLSARCRREAPLLALRESRGRLELARAALARTMRQDLLTRKEGLRVWEEMVRTLDPEAILRRGYTIVTRERGRKVLSRASQLRPGERFRLRMHKGTILGQVLGIQDEIDLFREDDPE